MCAGAETEITARDLPMDIDFSEFYNLHIVYYTVILTCHLHFFLPIFSY